jgi:hypothetical protein
MRAWKRGKGSRDRPTLTRTRTHKALMRRKRSAGGRRRKLRTCRRIIHNVNELIFLKPSQEHYSIVLTSVSIDVVLSNKRFAYVAHRSRLLDETPDPRSDWIQRVVDAVCNAENRNFVAKVSSGQLVRRDATASFALFSRPLMVIPRSARTYVALSSAISIYVSLGLERIFL